ncbi:TPA: mobilization protein, partial [Escherichia coli]|nr:mobilization protein [Salmonella enterica subsp. enterica serovar Stanley]EBX3672495.1 mobilization protein [Salmonella enterica subsp. enterica serovar Stanley]ECC9684623.1 mobilization protein [Salmonella enterica subsp. enterica]HAJ0368388.1 mobilization protein [Escherichia coli]HAJ0368491.1 mobilization protein [Escherichia coli]
WILGKVENGEWPEQRLLDGLDSYLERDHDRSLFGLPPKQKQQPQEHGQPEPQG